MQIPESDGKAPSLELESWGLPASVLNQPKVTVISPTMKMQLWTFPEYEPTIQLLLDNYGDR
jgi:hypothetical protein